MRFTILTTVYNEYELLRQLIESILINVDVQTYVEIIIVDDYSFTDGKLREYENYLSKTYKTIKVINFKESRASVYCNQEGYNRDNTDFRLYDSTRNIYDKKDFNPSDHCNWGPSMAVQIGLDKVDTEFVLVVDTDVIFLKKCGTFLNNMAKEFDDNQRIMSMGQVIGLNSNEVVLCKEQKKSKTSKTLRGGKSGEVSPMANACRMGAWLVHDLEPFARGKTITGWSNSHFLRDVFKKKFYTLNFPLFSDGYLVHLGRGTVSNQVPGRKNYGCDFGYCKTIPATNRYGGRAGVGNIVDWYSGRYVVNLEPKIYRAMLEEKYSSSFDTMVSFDESLLILEDE